MRAPQTTTYFAENIPYERPMRCNKQELGGLLLQQWKSLTRTELDQTRYIKRKIANLIERKYGIHSRITENYLSNLERTLPAGA